MYHVMFLLSLVAALAGTPLRLAEAADDLARVLTEPDDEIALEEVDSGVGDDLIVAMKAGGDSAIAHPAEITGWLMLPVAPPPSPWQPVLHRRADRASPLPDHSIRRQALFQRFLF